MLRGARPSKRGSFEGAEMPNTLGLDDDLDGVELRKSLEASFDVTFSDGESETCRTVGDIHRFLQERFSERGGAAQGCASAMAFYRLRREFIAFGVTKELQPNTVLRDISPRSLRRLFSRIRAHAGLRMPNLEFAGLGRLGVLLLAVGALALPAIAAVRPHFWWLPTLAGASGIALISTDARRFPSDCRTFGDLAKKVAALNFGKLVADGAGRRDTDLWNALLEVLSEFSVLPKAEISRETTILQRQIKK
jgi:hypothetical protein